MTRIHHVGDHAAHRWAAYARELPIGDQLDVMWRALAALREQGLSLPPEAAAMLDRIASIKRRHPKPQGSTDVR